MGLLFASFAALVTLSVATTLQGIAAQSSDAQVINLAGRQRMLIQAMARLTLLIEHDGGEEHIPSLRDKIGIFENTLTALEGGDLDKAYSGVISANSVWIHLQTQVPEIPSQLTQVRMLWEKYRASLSLVMAMDHNQPNLNVVVTDIQLQAGPLLQETDRLVRLYESEALAKVNRLRWIQVFFLAGAIGLLSAGAALTQYSILKPIKELSLSARRIGGGDLHSPVHTAGPGEIRLLGETIEAMRVDLNQTHQGVVDRAVDLEVQVAQRTRELEALFAVSRDISSRLEITEVLRSVTEQACRLLSGEAAFLCLLDGDGKFLKLHASSGASEAVCRSCSPVSSSLATQVLDGDRALHCHENGGKRTCQIISSAYHTSHLAAPLRMGERTIGALCVSSSKVNAFRPESSGQLTKLAQIAAVALENARLYQAAERTAMLEERQRIAAEMHDGLAQSISAIQMAMDLARMQIRDGKIERAADTLAKSRAAFEQANLDVRRAISSLQEDFPLHITLQDQLAGLVAELDNQSVRIIWEDRLITPVVLPHPQSEQVVRVAREAIINACSHSKAERIVMRLSVVGKDGILTIQDDGQGFQVPQPGKPGQNGKHFGLQIMSARAARIGGRLEIQSWNGAGTCVQLTWPLIQTNGNGG